MTEENQRLVDARFYATATPEGEVAAMFIDSEGDSTVVYLDAVMALKMAHELMDEAGKALQTKYLRWME